MARRKKRRWLKGIVSLLLDVFGYASYVIPGVGEVTDVVFAPVQGLWIYFAYKTTPMALIGVAEELLPFTDFVPSCTIAHYVRHKRLF